MLYFIKEQLDVGSVYIDKNKNCAQFKIQTRKDLANIIFPIFDQYPLLTSKHFSYEKLKQAYFIMEDKQLTRLQKIQYGKITKY